MDTVKGDKWVADYATWIRVHEAKLGDAERKALISSGHKSALTSNGNGSGLASSLWNAVGLGSGGTAVPAPSANGSRSVQHLARPLTLRLNQHYLYYLLIRFEALGLPTGPLDAKIPAAARPTSYFSYVSAPAKDKDDTMSMASFRSRMSVVSSSFSLGSSWWGRPTDAVDPSRDLKYIYAALTKIPSLRLGPIPATKLIEEFEDCPGKSAVPLDVFKNLHILELEDVDPRTLLGWDRVSMQLRSLTCRKSGLEDVTDLIIDLVIFDARRRRGERVDVTRHRITHGEPDSAAETETETETGNADGRGPSTGEGAGRESAAAENTASRPASPSPPPELPSLAWHFLRHLNLSNNSLTFVPSLPLKAMEGLTSLDLSSNILNVVPPALANLPNLTSLNVSDNLIDSVLGIYDALKAIKVLNLAKNRLESLCGVERLYTLQRIDLRTNCIFEAGEVGRLAPLPLIREVWVKDNPLEDELLDYRVDCFVEFAKEGRSVDLDGEAPGFFERQRITEKLPSASHALDQSSRRSQSGTTAAEEEAQAELEARQARMVVKAVKHRGSVAQRKAAERKVDAAKAFSGGAVAKSRKASGQSDTTKDGSNSDAGSAAMLRDTSKDAAAAAAKRRNRRLVDLESTPRKESTNPIAPQDDSKTESDLIKEAALSSNSASAPAPDNPPSEPTKETASHEIANAKDRTFERPEASRSPSRQFSRPSSMLIPSRGSSAAPGLTNTSRLTWSKKAGAAAASLSVEEPTGRHAKGADPATVADPSSGTTRAADPFQMLFTVPHAVADLPSISPKLARSNTEVIGSPTKPQSSRRRGSGSTTLGRSSGKLAFLRDHDAAFDTMGGSSSGAGTGRTTADVIGTDDAQTTARLRVPRPGTSSAAALARRSRVTASLYEPNTLEMSTDTSETSGRLDRTAGVKSNSGSSSGRGARLSSLVETAAAPAGDSADDDNGQGGRSEAFRRRIEALKGEVGDDWLRLLARGDAAYTANPSASSAADSGPKTGREDDPLQAAEGGGADGSKAKKKSGNGAGGGKRSKKRNAAID